MKGENRRILVERIKAQGLPSPGDSLLLVTLEEFFIGNDDYGSIGCNLLPPLGPHRFYEKLIEIRGRSNVHDVLVEINEVVEEDPTTWPFSDSVFVLTNATLNEVASWAAELKPDAIQPSPTSGRQRRMPDLPPGVRPYRLWWD